MLHTVTALPRTLGRSARHRIHATKVIALMARTAAQQTDPLGDVRLFAPITRPTLVTVPLGALFHEIVQRDLLAAAIHQIRTCGMQGPIAAVAGGHRLGRTARSTHSRAHTFGAGKTRYRLEEYTKRINFRSTVASLLQN